MIGAAAGSSPPPLGQCQWWNVLYGFNISFRAVELHTWQFLYHHVNELCSALIDFSIDEMEWKGYTYLNMQLMMLPQIHKWFTTRIYKQKYPWHKISNTCIDMWTLVSTYMLILWLCSYCASTWQRLTAAQRLAAAREMWISSYIGLIVTWRQSSIITWI